MRGLRYSAVARDNKYSEQFFRRVIGGHAPASPRFRSRLSAYLGMSESALFTDEP